MDKELERIMNMSLEERERINRNIDKRRLHSNHFKGQGIYIPKRDSEEVRFEKERLRLVFDRAAKKGRPFKIYNGRDSW